MKSILKKAGIAIGAILILIIAVATFNPLPGEQNTPSGFRQNMALYVPAKDGVRLAIDVWLPENLQPGEKIPTLIEGSRYWRALEPTLLGRIMNLFGQAAPGIGQGLVDKFFTDRGYAIVLVDVRGSGASFGVHTSEYSPEEMSDYSAIMDWIIQQSWSNGNIGAYGVSYAGTTAELMTTTHHPALKAVAPLYSDFDAQYHLGNPGGVFAPGFIAIWSASVEGMDQNDVCMVAGGGERLEGFDCLMVKLMLGGVKPVDEDGKQHLEQAISEHNTPNVAKAVRNLKFRDSTYAETGLALGQMQPYWWKEKIESSNIPMFIASGWVDAATADGTLARFHDFSNPQTIYIGPFNHGGSHHVDPFLPSDTPPMWNYQERYGMVEEFFRYYLKGEGKKPETGLNYYIMNEGGWQKTDIWPPEGRTIETLYFDNSNMGAELSELEASQTLEVDLEAGTGPQTRWFTQMGGGDVVYDDRRSQNGKVARFTSKALEEDLTIAGNVIADFYISSTTPEPAFHVYLEDVAPDGKITYITEGVLRAIHHPLSNEEPVYYHDGPYRSFLAKDAKPLVPGEVTKVTIPLYATAMKLNKGHKLQISLAGADKDVFQVYKGDTETIKFQIMTGANYPSQISLPVLK